jgi:putative ABC transport system substrate-binding protein
VFSIGGDPVQGGLVASLSHPGGNLTGATFFSNLLTAKRFGLLSELVPNAKVFGALVNPKNANAQMQTKEAEDAARVLSKRLVVVEAVGEPELKGAFDHLKTTQSEALIILSDAVLNAHGRQIAELALIHSLPTCFAYREPVDMGGLISYGATSRTDSMRQAGIYAGRILKGEKPADLPVQQPSKFEFVINMKTAKALNLAIPNSILLLADATIE